MGAKKSGWNGNTSGKEGKGVGVKWESWEDRAVGTGKERAAKRKRMRSGRER